MLNTKRIRNLNKLNKEAGHVVYWMSRDQRLNDNWALLFALQKAKELNSSVSVVFCLMPKFLDATWRQYDFMIKGLQEVEKNLETKNIPFFMLYGNPDVEIPTFIEKNNIGILVTDFSPLKISQNFKTKISKKIKIPFYEVDAHNIVPCWFASNKQEYSARTFRPKINKLLTEFLTDFPKITPQKIKFKKEKIDWDLLYKKLNINFNVKPINWLKPGESAANKLLKNFIKNKIDFYNSLRNDPTQDGQSNLSPYIHFGQISAQRIALEVLKKIKDKENVTSFLEELIVRRELAENFCFYNKNYDNIKSFPKWAQMSLERHLKDKREYIYNKNDLENAKTHDPLWNASQIELKIRGKMHGYMRMYWAKKILEWSKTPEEAQKIAIYLNDKYEIDGRDSNGYTGIAWSIGGVHDRAWPERKIFGNVRYMNYAGCKRKFNVEKYIEKYNKQK